MKLIFIGRGKSIIANTSKSIMIYLVNCLIHFTMDSWARAYVWTKVATNCFIDWPIRRVINVCWFVPLIGPWLRFASIHCHHWTRQPTKPTNRPTNLILANLVAINEWNNDLSSIYILPLLGNAVAFMAVRLWPYVCLHSGLWPPIIEHHHHITEPLGKHDSAEAEGYDYCIYF